MNAKRPIIWTFVVTSAALFMASLDNLVVTTALPIDPRPPARVTGRLGVDGQLKNGDIRTVRTGTR